MLTGPGRGTITLKTRSDPLYSSRIQAALRTIA
jgi:hypothetical protein